LHGQVKAPRCGITWIYHRQLLSFPGYTPDVCGLFIKTCKNKLVECFNAYGVIKGEQINVLHRNHDRLAVFQLVKINATNCGITWVSFFDLLVMLWVFVVAFVEL